MATKELPKLFAARGGAIGDAKRSKARTATARDFTYTALVDCGDGVTTKCAYILRGNAGRYSEDLCGGLYEGSLAFVGELDVDLGGGLVIRGWAYNGTDDSGVYGYFFSRDVVPEVEAFVVLLGAEHVQGQDYAPEAGLLATRTAP